MDLEFKVTCSTRFMQGKFAPRDDVAAEIVSAIESADPGDFSTGEGEYEVSDWTVEEITQPSRRVLKHQSRVDTARELLLNAVIANLSRGGSDIVLDKSVRQAFDRLQRLIKEKS